MTIPGVVPESSPATGELLDGRYLLDSRIGVGGMGVVYRARDEILGRTVAVKVFRESAADAARTTSETRLLASLNHSALVTLFDAQTGDDQPNYLVMEFVDGPTLRERISESPLPPAEVATMARDLAEALHVVHGAGVVHRDIKPSNVLLRASHVPGEQYRAKLADFGIAYLIDSTRLTTPGTLIGTAAYLSPEQVRGAEPAPASDIYALGLVLLEALTGQRAFPQTGTHEAALARLTRDPDITGSHGYAWRSLLTAMTSREAADRPTALEVVVAATHLNDEATDDATEATGALPTATAATVAFAPQADPTQTLVMPGAAPTVAAPATSASAMAASTSAATTPLTSPATATSSTDSPATTTATPTPAPTAARRRWPLIVAVIALLVVAVIVGLLIWWLGASAPADAPTLPTLEDPLNTHLQQLMEAVTP